MLKERMHGGGGTEGKVRKGGIIAVSVTLCHPLFTLFP